MPDIIPSHIAFIMDGNGRWAEAHGLSRDTGHKEGVEAFRRVLRYCGKIGVRYVTVYAFSTENWKRSKHEVTILMTLLSHYLGCCADELNENGVKFNVIGDRTALSRGLNKKIDGLIKATGNNEKVVLNVAINYGGRAEIVNACNRLISQGRESVTEDDIQSMLYTSGCPDPDLIVRSSGELRLSNFLIWQSAYSELYFTDTYWPDMNPEEIDLAIKAYNSRQRRFGGV